MQGKKQRLRAKMSKPSGLLPSMCPEKGAFVLHTTNDRYLKFAASLSVENVEDMSLR
jgi:hypothetical protein